MAKTVYSTTDVPITSGCELNCTYVRAQTINGTTQAVATCEESTNGQAITIDPEGRVCLNTGCNNHTVERV